MNEQIKNMMKALGLTEEEARELLEDDKKIDHGEKMDFDLTPEQEKESKKARATGTKKPTAYKFEKRARKENPTKRELIQRIFEVFKDEANAEITNAERVITFTVGDERFEIILQQKRKPKA